MFLVGYLLTAAFLSFRKGIVRTISVKKKKNKTEKKVETEKNYCLINGKVKENWVKKTQ